MITNKTNGKMYIGSTENIERRIKEHKRKLIANIHENYKLQIDFNTFKETSFTYKILEEVKDVYALKERENHYITLYNSINKGYNIINSNLPKIDTDQKLRTLMNNYFKKSKTSKVKIKIPYIKPSGTVRQTNLKIKIFKVLNEFTNVLDNYLHGKLDNKIIENSLTASLDIDVFAIDSIKLIISYTLKDNNLRQTIYFSISEIYKIMKNKDIDMQIAIIKCINNKKYLNNW